MQKVIKHLAAEILKNEQFADSAEKSALQYKEAMEDQQLQMRIFREKAAEMRAAAKALEQSTVSS